MRCARARRAQVQSLSTFHVTMPYSYSVTIGQRRSSPSSSWKTDSPAARSRPSRVFSTLFRVAFSFLLLKVSKN